MLTTIRHGLEHLVEKTGLFILQHPKSLAIASVFAETVYETFSDSPDFSDMSFCYGVYAGYLGLSILRDYVVLPNQRQKLHPPKTASRTRKALTAVLNHPKLVALAASSYLFSEVIGTEGLQDLGHPKDIISKAFFGATLTGLVAEPATLALRYGLGVAESRRAKKEKQPLLQSAYNFVFDHPLLVGTAAAVYGNLYRGFEHDDSLWHKGIISLLWAGAGATASLFTGAFLHTDSLSFYGHAIKSKAQSLARNTEGAVTSWKKAIQHPSSNLTLGEHLLHLAHLQKKAGNNEEARATLCKAAETFDTLETKLGHVDFLRSALSRRLMTPQKNLLAESTNTVLVYGGSERAKRSLVLARMDDIEKARFTYRVTEAVHSVLSPHKIRTIEPVMLVEHEESGTVITRHQPQRNFSQILGKRRFAKQKRLAQNQRGFFFYAGGDLAKFHHHTSSAVSMGLGEEGMSYGLLHRDLFIPLDIMDYPRELEQRAFEGAQSDKNSRLIFDERSTLVLDIVEELKELVAELQPQATSFTHRDLTAQNVLGDGTILDYERVGIGHPLIDLAMFAADINSPDAEQALIEGYYSNLSPEQREEYPSRQCQIAKLAVALGFVGTTLSKAKKVEARAFMQQAFDALACLDKKVLRADFKQHLKETEREWLIPA